MNRVAQKIKDARRKAGMTEKQLAKKCGLGVSYILQVESGKKIINEKTADRILAVLGEEIALVDVGDSRQEEEVQPARRKSAASATYTVEPNEQWASALEGVIKKYPIHAMRTGQTLGKKEMVIQGKKVEGHHPDKLIFVRVDSDETTGLRIKKGDTVMVMKTKEIQNNGIYLLKKGKQQIIRKVRRDKNQLYLAKDHSGSVSEIVAMNEMELVGKCIRVEFEL
jgi:transcriptional regulator with XRE-family HTH domain